MPRISKTGVWVHMPSSADVYPNDLDIPQQNSWDEMAAEYDARALNMWGLIGNGPAPGDKWDRRNEGGIESDADRRR